MRIVEKDIKELKPYKNNPRNNDNAVDAVAASIKEFGFKVPIVVDRNNEIVAGHTRYRASLKLGLATVPCIVADDLNDEQIGAGDQGIMFGYATCETESRLPKAFDYANKIIRMIENDVPNGVLKGDAKTQVTIDLDTNEMKTTVISVCHIEKLTIHELRKYVTKLLIEAGLYDDCETFIINPAGTWSIGGPIADCGLTGRKIVCDQYGGFCQVGGGAFSGKDPTKVDRSASYMARRIAVDLVNKFNLKSCMVQLGYAIGLANPVSVIAEADGKTDFNRYIKENYDLTPKGIINHLGLYSINYEILSEGCHYR